MNKTFVMSVNKEIRDKRPFFSDDRVVEVFQEGDLLEIGFLSKQCKNDLAGSCLMCDYGRAKGTLQNRTYLDKMRAILNEYKSGINFLLLCCNGSILDEYQISTELLREIFVMAESCSIPNIIIETHYKDISVYKLDLIKREIKKPVIIEMGLETINQKYQNNVFMKNIDICEYERVIELIKSYGYDIELNLLLGLPFLSTKEQLAYTIESVRWAISHQCTPIVFPISIKPYTMLRYAYDNELYQPISLWLLIVLLDSLKPVELKNVLIAWYGNRDDSYSNDTPNILPRSCSKCKETLSAFGRAFLDTKQSSERKNLIKKLIGDSTCDCYRKVITDINQSKDLFNETYSLFYQLLSSNFGDLEEQ